MAEQLNASAPFVTFSKQKKMSSFHIIWCENSEVFAGRKMSEGAWIPSVKGQKFKKNKMARWNNRREERQAPLEMCWAKTTKHIPLFRWKGREGGSQMRRHVSPPRWAVRDEGSLRSTQLENPTSKNKLQCDQTIRLMTFMGERVEQKGNMVDYKPP